RIPELAQQYPQPVAAKEDVFHRLAREGQFNGLPPAEQDKVLAELAATRVTHSFDVEGARRAGYSNSEIMQYLLRRQSWPNADPQGPRERKIEGLPSGAEVRPIYRYAKLPNNTSVGLALTTPTSDLNKFSERVCQKFPYLPKWHCDALAAGVDMDAVAEN